MISKSAAIKGNGFSKGHKGNGKASERLEVAEVNGGNGHVDALVLAENGKVLTLTVDDLTHAIKTGIDHTGMPEDQARAMAQHVMNFFGYSERIIDNILEPEDRDAFYMLEDTGILTTEREETTLYDGREWRIHYWLFKKERIFELISGNGRCNNGADGIDTCYDEVPDEVWHRNT
ncbi:MAG: hypothetical protein MUE65_02905 [Methanomassiliicoccales archaeon]|jgi:hypothetical protein|nr:hypothetical protein [Methanomassiliicoccales archaeon]